MAEVWVTNASPVIILSKIDRLDLLEKLPSRLLLPSAVADEILAGPEDAAHRAMSGGWGPRSSTLVPVAIAEWGLGRGESAVIALELNGTAVVDDRSARRCARSFGVPVIGTLGVVARARQKGFIPAAKPLIQAILGAGLYYDPTGIRGLLESPGESWP